MSEEKKKKRLAAEKLLLSKFKGKGNRICRFCGNSRGLIRSYQLFTCRRCFREVAEQIGFRQYD